MEAIGCLAGALPRLQTSADGSHRLLRPLLQDLAVGSPSHDLAPGIKKPAERPHRSRSIVRFQPKQVSRPRLLNLNELRGERREPLLRLIGEDMTS